MRTKKIALAVAAAGAVVAPILTVVSCGKHKHDDLTIGIRPEDQPLWDKVAKEFKKATGKKVGFKWVTNQSNDYAAWSGSGMMPDISIADSGWAKTGVEKNWFQQIDIDDIAKNPDYKITGQDKEYAEGDIKFDELHFEKAMMDTMQTDGDKYNGLAVIYGPNITYAWKKLPKQDGGFFDLYDGKVPLKYYVPNENGKMDEVTSFESDTDSPLFSKKADKHRLKNTVEDVQEFLTNAVNANDLKYNTADIQGDLTTPESRVLSTGTYGYFQRLASASKVIFDYVKSSGVAIKGSGANINNLKVGAAADASLSYSALAYGDALNKTNEKDVEASNDNLDANNVMNDNLVFSKGNDPKKFTFGVKSGNKISSEYEKMMYYGSLGYFHQGMLGNGGSIDGDDRQDAFAKFKTLFVGNGALWMWGGIKDKVESKFSGFKADDLVTSFGQPIQEAGVDGYAISKSVSGDKLKLAKEFLRFMMQKQVASDITGTKAKSTLKDAQQIQETIEGARNNGLAHAGASSIELADQVGKGKFPYTVSKATKATDKLNGHDNTPVYDSYTEFWMKGTAFNNINYTTDTGASVNTIQSAMDIYNTKYMDSFIA